MNSLTTGMDSEILGFEIKLRKLNMAQLGSFGEYVFVSTINQVMNVKVERLHDNRADFLVNENPVDVKTTIQNIDKDLCDFSPYAGQRISGIQYALVEFFRNGARISLENAQLGLRNLRELDELWLKWRDGYGKKLPVNKNELKKQLLKPIKNEIEGFFYSHGIEVRIIQRTCQRGFGNESPHNLKPTHIKINGATVFLSFNDSKISRDNFHKIIAFPDTDADKLPMRDKVYLHKPKVDLDRLPQQYVFKNINDLKEHYFKRFR